MKRISPLLSPEERTELKQCIVIIHDGNSVVQRWGDALIIIKEKSLWRENYKSFEHFIETEAGWTRQHANRLIRAARFISNQATLADQGESVVVPQTEHEARTLMKEANSPLTPSDLPDLPRVAEAPPVGNGVDNNKELLINSKVVLEPAGYKIDSQNRENLGNGVEINDLCKTENSGLPLPKRWKDCQGRDVGGYPVPPNAVKGFSARSEMLALAEKLAGILFHVERATVGREPGWRFLISQDWINGCTTLIESLRITMPAHVCPYCQGRIIEVCTECRGSGVVPKYFFERQADKDMVRMRQLEVSQLPK